MLDVFFKARKVAVVGASATPGKVGHDALHNLVSYGFKGEVIPVNPKGGRILGLEAVRSVEELPEGVDMAVVAVPAEAVVGVVEGLGARGVKGCVVLSAGFKEVGGRGAELERELGKVVAARGMRLIGPNCVGIIDTATGLNASFAAGMPSRGQLGFFSQSGAMCLAIMDWAQDKGIGFSKFISLGNKLDVTETEVLEYLATDPDTKVILGYLEAVEDGRKFMEVAARVTRAKPVVLFKSGVTHAGARAATSHTGALAGADAAYEAAFRQCGVLRVRSVRQLFNLALALAHQPLPAGPAVVLLTNSGGPGIIAADAAEMNGLHMAALSPETVEELRSFLPPIASLYNPVDITGGAPAEHYARSLEAILPDPNVHAVAVIMTPTATVDPAKVAEAVCSLQGTKPIFAVFMGDKTIGPSRLYCLEHGVPAYEFPEEAMEVIRGMLSYGRWRASKPRSPEIIPGDKQRVGEIIARARSQQRIHLSETEARECFRAYGVRLPRSIPAATSEEAVEAAREIGLPVVLKIDSPAITHKSDVGGVVVGLSSEQEVARAFHTLTNRIRRLMPQAWIRGVLVQEMVAGGRETIVGLSRDAQFGPLIMFGLGGIYVEVLKDVAFRVGPVSRKDAEEMIKEIRSLALLRGVRGEPPADLKAIAQVILALSSLAHDFPEIAEADINPLLVLPRGEGAVAVDARIVLSQPKGEN